MLMQKHRQDQKKYSMILSLKDEEILSITLIAKE
jgi:hypothetical protein